MIDIKLLKSDIEHCKEVIAKAEMCGDNDKCLNDHKRLLSYMETILKAINVSANVDERINYFFGNIDGEYMIPKNMRFMNELLGEVKTLTCIVNNTERWIIATKPVNDYPIGTKYRALTGGYWIKTERGFKWCTGATFPNVGGDWDGTISLF